MVAMFLRYNASTEIDFFMPDDSDPWSGKTGLTGITVQYKKQGQSSFTTLSSPTITEIGNGWYKLSVPTTLVDTYGFLVIRFSATGAKPQQQQYQVVAFNPYDSNMGLANLDAAVSSRMPSGNVTVGGYASGQDPATLVWSHSTRTLTSFGTLVADIWDHSTRTLTNFGTLVNDTASAVWSYTIEASQSAVAWMRLMGAALFGKLNRSGNSYAFRDWNDSKNRIAGSVDNDGNRTITTRDGS
jgi:hypothetical protein